MTLLTRRATTLALLLLAAAAPGAAHAAEWRWTVTPYVWATDVGIEARVAGSPVVDETIPVGDLLEDLDTIFQLRAEAQRGAFGVTLDVFDVRLSDRTSDLPLPGGAGEADLDSEMGMTILDFAGLYDPKGDGTGLSFLYGTRILDERATIDATFTPTGGTPLSVRHEPKDTMVDGLVGVRYRKVFSHHWSARLHADASAGGSDHTWSVGPGVSYAFGASGRHALTAGYRHMEVHFDDDDDPDAAMTLSGPLLGFRMSF